MLTAVHQYIRAHRLIQLILMRVITHTHQNTNDEHVSPSMSW